MTDWAAKVLEGVGRIWAYSYEVNEADNGAEPEDWKTFQTWDVADPYPILGKEYVAVDDALAAIARMGAGDGLVERLQDAFNACRPMNGSNELDNAAAAISDAIAHIAALTAQNTGLQACIEQLQGPLTVAALTARAEAAEAEAAALRERVARLEGALRSCPPTSNPTVSAQWHLDRIKAWWRLEARVALKDEGSKP